MREHYLFLLEQRLLLTTTTPTTTRHTLLRATIQPTPTIRRHRTYLTDRAPTRRHQSTPKQPLGHNHPEDRASHLQWKQHRQAHRQVLVKLLTLPIVVT